MAEDKTFTIRSIRQVVMVQGWQAVYWEDNQHTVYPIDALGLGYRNVYTHGHGDNPKRLSDNNEEEWEIYALDYTYVEGWGIAEEVGNFCGLIKPGDCLETFESYKRCQNKHSSRKSANSS